MNVLLTVDGAAFIFIGLVVLAIPSPQPALLRPVDEEIALVPFKDTRRLLASQFIGSGLLTLVLGWAAMDAKAVLRLAAGARLLTILLVLAINVRQLRGGFWKRPPLYFIATVLGALGLGYGRFLLG